MSEHERLKKICYQIKFKPKFKFIQNEYEREDTAYSYWVNIDVREIIFTPEFMDKLRKFLREWNEYWYSDIWENLLLRNLHDPVTFLYNLLFNK
jgi:hypothetical protein